MAEVVVLPPPVADTASTGVFVDSAVAGVAYKTATKSGTTNDKGEYQYQAGETVTFSIGGVVFPPVLAKGVVTPFDMAGTLDVNNQQVLNIALLLQTLDADEIPSNGIQITSDMAAALANTTVAGNSFDTDINSFKGLFTSVNSNSWKDINAVKDHLANANGLVGTWLKAGSDADGLVFIKLEADGQYFLLSDQQSQDLDVLQVGTYEVDPTNQTITFNLVTGDSSTTLVSGQAYPIKTTDNLLAFELTADDGSYKFERTASLAAQTGQTIKQAAINGVWAFDLATQDNQNGINEPKLVAFNADNTYFVFSLEGSETGDNSGLPDGAVVYEKGTYSIEEDGALNFTVTENKDGDKGFVLAENIEYSLSESGSLTLAITTVESEGQNLVRENTLTKLLPFVEDK